MARASYGDAYPMMYYCGHTVECQLALMDLIVGGVMNGSRGCISASSRPTWRGCRVAGPDGQPGKLARQLKRGKKVSATSALPTEYFRRQCFVAAFPDDAWIGEVLTTSGGQCAAVHRLSPPG